MTTPDLIAKYRGLGWTFRQSSWVSNKYTGEVHVAYYFQSPRVQHDVLINDGFSEEELLSREAEAYVSMRYGTVVAQGLLAPMHDIMARLTAAQLAVDRGDSDPFPNTVLAPPATIKLGVAS